MSSPQQFQFFQFLIHTISILLLFVQFQAGQLLNFIFQICLNYRTISNYSFHFFFVFVFYYTPILPGSLLSQLHVRSGIDNLFLVYDYQFQSAHLDGWVSLNVQFFHHLILFIFFDSFLHHLFTHRLNKSHCIIVHILLYLFFISNSDVHL